MEHKQHVVDALDETLVQKCILCDEVIEDYRNAMFSPGTKLENIGWRPGVIYISQGTNPTIKQTELDDPNATIISCFNQTEKQTVK
jgi:hypothetical protein